MFSFNGFRGCWKIERYKIELSGNPLQKCHGVAQKPSSAIFWNWLDCAPQLTPVTSAEVYSDQWYWKLLRDAEELARSYRIFLLLPGCIRATKGFHCQNSAGTIIDLKNLSLSVFLTHFRLQLPSVPVSMKGTMGVIVQYLPCTGGWSGLLWGKGRSWARQSKTEKLLQPVPSLVLHKSSQRITHFMDFCSLIMSIGPSDLWTPLKASF